MPPIAAQQSVVRKMGCECRRTTRGNPGKTCDECERRECFEWNWEKDGTGTTVVFHNNDRDVIFNPGFSVGTAAVRGTQPFKPGYHHYWEVEMSTEVYGTDMMIGVGTEKTDLRKYSHNFVSLLGIDEQSWGLSYSGEKKHGGQSNRYSKPFGQNSIVGVHLDLWAGTMEFYINRKPLGLAFEGLRDKVLYPIISSTAARSGMNLIFCRSYPESLQLQSMLAISKTMLSPGDMENASLFKVLNLPPGLKSWMKSNYWWIVSCRDRDRKREDELNNRIKSDKETRKRKQAASDPPVEEADKSEEDSESEDDEFDITREPSSTRRRIPQQCSQAIEAGTAGSGHATSCMQFLAATSSRAHFLGRVSPIFVGMPEGGYASLPNVTIVPSAVASSSVSSIAAASASNSGEQGAEKPVTRSRINVTVIPNASCSAAPEAAASITAESKNGSATAGSVMISFPASTSSASVVGSGLSIAVLSSHSVSSSTSTRSQRQPSSSEDEDATAKDGPTRKVPKRLRLRDSIETEDKGQEAKKENAD